MSTNKQPRGFIALISVLMLSVILLVAVISLAQYGIISRYALLTLEHKEISASRAEACVQVARIAVSNDPLYETTNKQVAVGDSWCELVSIEADDDTSIVEASASSSEATTNLRVEIDNTTGSISKHEEVPNF
jgi:Tfp pilus assembly protein PilX